MEENIRQKEYNATLKEQNERYLDAFTVRDKKNQKSVKLNVFGNRELHYKVLVFHKIKDNVMKLESRERFQEKNLKGLVKYAKKLTVELEDYKQKVIMSENILNDLKKAGSDNMSNLIEMMSQFKEREASAVEEIEKLKKL